MRLMFAPNFALQNDRVFDIERFFDAEMFHFVPVLIAQPVNTETVLVFVNNIEQFEFQRGKLCRIDDAFKNGVLHTLSVRCACFGHPTQTSLSACVRCIYIVCDHHHHITFHLYFHKNGGYSSRSPRKYLANNKACTCGTSPHEIFSPRKG